MDTVIYTSQPMDRRLVESLQVAREYLGPEAAGLPDAEIVHRLMIRAIDYQRQLSETTSKRPKPQ
jgi:hypothetical protein